METKERVRLETRARLETGKRERGERIKIL